MENSYSPALLICQTLPTCELKVMIKQDNKPVENKVTDNKPTNNKVVENKVVESNNTAQLCRKTSNQLQILSQILVLLQIKMLIQLHPTTNTLNCIKLS